MKKEEKNIQAKKSYHKRKKEKKCKMCGKLFLGKDKQFNCPEHRRMRKKKVKKSKPCLLCKKDRGRNKKFCSKKCASKSLKKRKIVNCDFCNKEVVRCPSLCSNTNFCSKKCFYKYKTDRPNLKIRREKHPNWKGGKRKRSTTSISYKKWRRKVYFRDDYTCQRCFKRGGDIVAHHILPWATHPKKRYVISNGLTLCKPCHLLEHKGSFRVDKK